MQKLLFSTLLIFLTRFLCFSQDYNVYFATNSAVLRINDIDKLDELLKQFEKSKCQFTLTGYADTSGSNNYNLALSAKRVNAVRDYLTSKKVPQQYIKTAFYGEKGAAGNNSFFNRRIEISISHSVKTSAKKTYRQFLEELKPQKQVFTVYADSAIVLEGNKGTVLRIPENAFQFTNGWEVSGRFSIELTEYYSIPDYFSDRLTTISNGNLLSSGGMINLKALKNGSELVLKDNVSIEVAFPKSSDNNFKTFYGERTSEGNINWIEDSTSRDADNNEMGFTFSADGSELIITDKKTADENNSNVRLDRVNGGFKILTKEEAQALDKYIKEQQKIDESRSKYYNVLMASKLNYINCDAYFEDAFNLKTLITILIENKDIEILTVTLIYNNIALSPKGSTEVFLSSIGLVEIPKINENSYSLNAILPRMPGARLLVTGMKNHELFMWSETINLNTATEKINKSVNLMPESYDELKQVLKG